MRIDPLPLRARALTCIEIFFFLLAVAAGVIGTILGWRHGGVFLAVLLGVTGLFVPFGLAQLMNGLAYVCDRIWPPRPHCANGRCSFHDYEVVSVTGKDVILVCKCGDRYFKSGKRFMRLGAEETRKPYMVSAGWGRWRPDIRDTPPDARK